RHPADRQPGVRQDPADHRGREEPLQAGPERGQLRHLRLTRYHPPMFLVTVAEKGGGSQQIQFEKAQVTIGRLEGNDIVLSKGNVSKYHSRLVAHEGKIVIEALKSPNGTYVNKKRIAVKQVVRPTDEIAIGDYVIRVQPYGSPASTKNAPPKLYPVDQGS